MDTCFSKNCGIVNIIFYGQIQKEELFAKLKYEDVVISLRSDTIKYAEIPKIGISKEISPIALKDKSQSIIIPVSGIGNVSTTRKKILQNSLEDELKEYFNIISQDRFEEAQEKAFAELDYEECTEDQCIMLIQEFLQVENVFYLEVIGEGKITQMSISWRTLDQNQKETDVCFDCGTFELNGKIKVLIQNLINN